jgi:hypothetical protein
VFHSRRALALVFGAEGCTGSGHRLRRMGGHAPAPLARLARRAFSGTGPPALAHGRPRPGGAEALGGVPATCLGACAARAPGV